MAKTDVDWLAEIRSCHEMAGQGEKLKIRAIVAARKMGFPWEAIGSAMGITRQGAVQRYGKFVK
jgi:hypothetical protein